MNKRQRLLETRRYWRSIEDEIRKFLAEKWTAWEQEKPKWFDNAWIASVHDDMLPERALAERRRGGRRRSSIAEVMFGANEDEEEEDDESEPSSYSFSHAKNLSSSASTSLFSGPKSFPSPFHFFSASTSNSSHPPHLSSSMFLGTLDEGTVAHMNSVT